MVVGGLPGGNLRKKIGTQLIQGVFPGAAAGPQWIPKALEAPFLPSLVPVNSGSSHLLCTSLALGELDLPGPRGLFEGRVASLLLF